LRRIEVTWPCDASLAVVTWSYLVFAYLGFAHPLLETSVCPFLLLTGLKCPLCGATHFIGALLHGTVDPERFTVIGLVWFAVIVALAALSTVQTIRIMGWLGRGGARRLTLIRPPAVNRKTTPCRIFSVTCPEALVPSSLGALSSFRRAGTGSRNLHQTLIEAQWPWSHRIRGSDGAA